MSKSKRALFGAQPMPNPARISRPTIELATLRTDGGTQPREHLDEETLQEYAERMRFDEVTGFALDPEQNKWPELVVFSDGTDHWLADGFHRYSAALRAGLTQFQVRREEGSQRDAVLYSLGVNATHGKRRTNADKRRAIERALQDQEWRQWSDSRLATLCKVSAPMVGRIRQELEQRQSIPFEAILYGADGREFERERPASVASAVTPIAEAAPRKEEGRGASHDEPRRAATSHKPFSHLDKKPNKRAHTIIAYPTSEEHWSKLAQRAADHLQPDTGRLIVHLANQPQLFQVAQQISESQRFEACRLCYVVPHDRHYAVWSFEREPALGASLKQTATLGLLPDQTLVLGTPLDAW